MRRIRVTRRITANKLRQLSDIKKKKASRKYTRFRDPNTSPSRRNFTYVDPMYRTTRTWNARTWYSMACVRRTMARSVTKKKKKKTAARGVGTSPGWPRILSRGLAADRPAHFCSSPVRRAARSSARPAAPNRLHWYRVYRTGRVYKQLAVVAPELAGLLRAFSSGRPSSVRVNNYYNII